jgi:lipopolysaccharide biosynthesis regulator YciM
LKIQPIYLAITGVLLVVVIFFFGKMNGPANGITKSEHANTTATTNNTSIIDFDAIIIKAKKSIAPATINQLDSLEKKLPSVSNQNEKIIILNNLIKIWQQEGSKIITANYANQLAELTKTPNDYAKAGNYLVIAFETAADSTLQKPLIDMAFITLQKAIKSDSNNIENLANMGACLMEGRNQVMDGVLILKDVVKKSPNHLKANFILAKFAVVSGQYDKAIIRLEKLISNYPTYTDAYLVLANAYASKGETLKAKQILQNCQRQTTDAQVKTELDQLIKQFN